MKINWTKEQLNLMGEIEIPFDVSASLSDDQICDLDDYVSSYMLRFWVKDDEIFGNGLLCESILDVLGDL